MVLQLVHQWVILTVRWWRCQLFHLVYRPVLQVWKIILIRQGNVWFVKFNVKIFWLIHLPTSFHWFLLLLHFLLRYGLFLGTTLLTSMNWMRKRYHFSICKVFLLLRCQIMHLICGVNFSYFLWLDPYLLWADYMWQKHTELSEQIDLKCC